MTVSPADSGDQGAPTEAPEVEAGSDVKAESSPANQGVGEKTSLEAVQAALKAGSEKSPPSGNLDPEVQPDPTKAEEKLPDEISPEELKKYGWRAQQRIKDLVATRDAHAAKIDELQVRAAGFDKVQAFARQHQLESQDIDNAYALMAEIKSGDPNKALQMLVPVVQHLMKTAGLQLPDDLAQEVKAGAITEQRAREYSQAKAAAERESARAQQEREQREYESQARAHDDLVRSRISDVDEWYVERTKSDPDWSLKKDRQAQLFELELRRNGNKVPATKEEVRALCDKTLKQVEDEIKAYLPKTKLNVAPPTVGSSSPRSFPQAKTSLEAVKQSLAQMRG